MTRAKNERRAAARPHPLVSATVGEERRPDLEPQRQLASMIRALCPRFRPPAAPRSCTTSGLVVVTPVDACSVLMSSRCLYSESNR